LPAFPANPTRRGPVCTTPTPAQQRADDRLRACWRPRTDYFLGALATLEQNRQCFAQAEARTRQHRPSRPVYFDQ
jgi:hypothetical protein